MSMSMENRYIDGLTKYTELNISSLFEALKSVKSVSKIYKFLGSDSLLSTNFCIVEANHPVLPMFFDMCIVRWKVIKLVNVFEVVTGFLVIYQADTRKYRCITYRSRYKVIEHPATYEFVLIRDGKNRFGI